MEKPFTHNWGTNNDLIIGTWDYLYGVIVQCNQSIDKLVSLKEQDPENEYYEIYRSEVRAIRAMYYYYLLDMFARVPIVESSLTQMADVKQSERTDVFNFVKRNWKNLFHCWKMPRVRKWRVLRTYDESCCLFPYG